MNTSSRLFYGLGLSLKALRPLFRNFHGQWSSYRPFFQPWREDAFFQRYLSESSDRRMYSDETIYHVYQFARAALQADGDFWECGVYRGGSSILLAELLLAENSAKHLHLFDTFTGLPEASELDKYRAGELAETSFASVQERLERYPFVRLHPGIMPATFAGMENAKISFALLDVDQQESTSACLRFVFPRLTRGGVILVDDYGRPGTYGCRVAVDQYLEEVNAKVLVFNTGQAVILK